MDAASDPPSRLARALRAAEEVAAAVGVAFGPQGRGVLVQGPTGGLAITRGALDVLEAAFPSSATSPEHVVLLQGARSLRQQTGDGVKSFVLTTAALLRGLRGLRGLEGPQGAASARVELARASAALSAALPRRPLGDEPSLDAALVAESVLATRFTADVAAAALPAVASLLCGAAGADLAHLRTHLGLLCRRRHAAGHAVADSAVRDGVVVDGLLRFLDGEAAPRRVVVLAGHDEDDAADVQAAVRSLLADAADAAGDALLVATSAVLPDASLFALRRRGVAVLHGVAPEDERFLLDWTLRRGEGASVEVRAERGAAWLGLSSARQLQMRAPTQQLADQLASAVRDAVQLACFAGGVSVGGGAALCEGGGTLERALHRALGGVPLGRAELLQWHQHRVDPGPQPHDAVGLVVQALQGLSPGVRGAVAEAVAAVPRALPAEHRLQPPLEPVALRVAVLQHALAVAETLLSVDGVLPAKRL